MEKCGGYVQTGEITEDEESGLFFKAPVLVPTAELSGTMALTLRVTHQQSGDFWLIPVYIEIGEYVPQVQSEIRISSESTYVEYGKPFSAKIEVYTDGALDTTARTLKVACDPMEFGFEGNIELVGGGAILDLQAGQKGLDELIDENPWSDLLIADRITITAEDLDSGLTGTHSIPLGPPLTVFLAPWHDMDNFSIIPADMHFPVRIMAVAGGSRDDPRWDIGQNTKQGRTINISIKNQSSPRSDSIGSLVQGSRLTEKDFQTGDYGITEDSDYYYFHMFDYFSSCPPGVIQCPQYDVIILRDSLTGIEETANVATGLLLGIQDIRHAEQSAGILQTPVAVKARISSLFYPGLDLQEYSSRFYDLDMLNYKYGVKLKVDWFNKPENLSWWGWIKNKFSSTEPVVYNGKCSIGENGFLIAEEEPQIQVGGLNLPGITINQTGTYFFNAWFEPVNLSNGNVFESGVEYIGNNKYSFGMQISDTNAPYVKFMACALSPDSQKEKILLEIVKRMPVAGAAAGKLATLSDIACKLQKGELPDAMLAAGAFIAGETLNVIDKSYPTSLSSREKELLDLALKTNQIAGYQAFLEAILPDVRAPLSLAADDDLTDISFQEFHDLCSAFVRGILGENLSEKRIISVFGADAALLADGDGKYALSVDEIGEDLSNLGEEMTASSGPVASFILDNDKIHDLELETTADCFIRIDDPASGASTLYVLNAQDYAKGSLQVTPAMTEPLLVDDGGDGSVDREIRPEGSFQARAGFLPDTGQAKCYNNTGEIACPSPGEAFYGQDAQYPAGGRSYTKLDAGGTELPDSATRADGWIMTRDNVTGLVWAIKTDAAGIQNKDNTYSWYDPDPETNGGDAGTPDGGSCTGSDCDTHSFIQAMNDQSYGGFSDWRMPTVKELSLLVNSGRNSPAIDAGWFPGTVSAEYWSSTSYLEKYAWRVDFERGVVSGDYKASDVMRIDYHVLAVRSGQQDSPAGLLVNNDGTVSDPATCLMWQHETGPETYTWEQALAYAEALRLGGYDDWRVPDRNELQSIADYSFRDPAVDPLLAPGTEPSRYWSSTTSNHDTSRAWGVYFFNGAVFHQSKTNSYHVRAVRSIETTPAALSIDPESHDFGDVTVGASGPARIFTITNIGGGSMVLGTIGITGVDISAFAVLNDTCSGQSLSALASCSVDVVFLPDSEGHKSASLVIPSDHVYVLKDLTGKGIAGGGALAGDVDGDNFITLADLIICLKISTGMKQADIHLTADVDEDGRIGIPEAVYIAEHIAFSGE